MSATTSLFNQDPARNALVRSVLTALAVGVLFRMVPDIATGIPRLQADEPPDGFVYLYFVVTAFVVFMILSANSWTRSSRLALGLPISTRRAWSVRIISLIAVALFSTAALAITTGITIDLTNGAVGFNSVILLAAARAAVTSVLLLFLFQLPLSSQYRIPITAPYVVYVIFTGVILIVFSGAALQSFAVTLALFLVTVSLGAWLAIRVPPTFSVGPSIEESLSPLWITPEEVEPIDVVGWGDDSRGHSKRTIHRVLFKNLKPNLLIWFLLAIVAASAAVATLEFLKGTNAFMPFFFVIIYHVPLLQGALESMTPFDPLPISRRLLWAHTVAPLAAAAAIGLAIAALVFVFNPRSFTQIHVSKGRVEVPWDYWEISRDERVPTVTAPSGESYRPVAHPLWAGSEIAIFDPYESGPDSSPRFVEFQLQRAVRAVYGDSTPGAFWFPDAEPPESDSGLATRGTFKIDSIRGRLSSDRCRTAAVALSIPIILITVLMLPALLQHGRWVHRKSIKRASIGAVILLVAAVIAVSAARLLGFTQVWYLGVLISVGIRFLSHALPVPTGLLWIFCMFWWVGAYLLLGRVFNRIEFPREKTMNRFAEEY